MQRRKSDQLKVVSGKINCLFSGTGFCSLTTSLCIHRKEGRNLAQHTASTAKGRMKKPCLLRPLLERKPGSMFAEWSSEGRYQLVYDSKAEWITHQAPFKSVHQSFQCFWDLLLPGSLSASERISINMECCVSPQCLYSFTVLPAKTSLVGLAVLTKVHLNTLINSPNTASRGFLIILLRISQNSITFEFITAHWGVTNVFIKEQMMFLLDLFSSKYDF